jgi:putative peptidoglycan lipid II flippase
MTPAPRRPSAPRGRLAAAAVAAGIFLSRVAGLVRERVFAHYLGSDASAGAFRAALRIPNLLQTLFGEGALSASFIPVYARLLAEGRREDAAKVAGTVSAALALVASVIVVCGVTWADGLVALLAPGFSEDARQETVLLVRLMFPGVGLLVLSAWCLGVLNSHRRFFLSYVAPVLWNVAIIAAIVLAAAGWLEAAWIGQLVGGRAEAAAECLAAAAELARWAAVGVTVGSALQLLVQLPGAWRANGGVLFAWQLRAAGFRDVLRNFLPALGARGVVQISAYIDQVLSSFLGATMVAAIAYAQTIALLPVSLFGVAIAAAELPEMASARGDQAAVAEALRLRLRASLARLIVFVAPSTVALLLIGDAVIATLLRTGSFDATDQAVVRGILAAMAVSLPWATRGRLFSSAFWALGDTRTTAWTALARVTFGAVVGWTVVFPVRAHFELGADVAAVWLVGGAGVAAIVECVVLGYLLDRRIGGVPHDFGHRARVWGAALLAGAAAYGGGKAWPEAWLTRWPYPWLWGIGVMAVFGVVYGVLGYWLGVSEIRALARRVAAKLGARG